MTATVKTLYNEFPQVFINRIIISVLMIAVLFAVTLLLYKRKKIDKIQRNTSILLSLYVVVLLYLTVIGRYSHPEYEYKIYVFLTYRRFLENIDAQSVRQLIINIGMLVPVGFLLPVVLPCKRKYTLTLLISFLLIILIEVMQFVMKCGTFEIDDIVNNMIGAIVGILVYRLFETIYHKHHTEKQ